MLPLQARWRISCALIRDQAILDPARTCCGKICPDRMHPFGLMHMHKPLRVGR